MGKHELKQRISPQGEWILVQPDDRQTRTPGGLALPEARNAPICSGRVLAVGRGVAEKIPVDIIGCRIIVQRFTALGVDGVILDLAKASDVIAIVEPTENANHDEADQASALAAAGDDRSGG